MKKHDKEVLQSRLDAEEKELKRLKAIYNKAADDIMKKIEISNGKISVLLANWDDLTDEEKSIYQSQIYQRNFQKSLKTQIDGFLKDLNSKQYATMTEYMEDCYKNGYLGAMYSIHKQGIPIISPIDQKKVTKAMFTDSKISKKLYTKLGEDVEVLKKRIANNLSRGIATASDYKVIARNIAADSNVGFNRAMRITRTEGNRISNESAYDASMSAKDKGADVVKSWDAALDGRTRESHARVDGEIRELDEKFSNGLKYPGDSAGGAAEVVNCRCALLQRAKWALDEDELETLKERAAFYGLDKSKNFEDFQKKYLKAAESVSVSVPKPAKAFTPAKTVEEAEKYARTLGIEADYSKYHISVANAMNEAITKIQNDFGENSLRLLKEISTESGKHRDGAFDPWSNKLLLRGVSNKNSLQKMGDRTRKANERYPNMKYFSSDDDLSTIYHEIGHALHCSLGGSADTAASKLDRDIIAYMRDKNIKVISEVSYYATIDNQELVAECIAQYYTGTPSEITMGIIDILKKYAK